MESVSCCLHYIHILTIDSNVPGLQRSGKGGQKIARIEKSNDMDYFRELPNRKKRFNMSNIDPQLLTGQGP